jgi:integrase
VDVKNLKRGDIVTGIDGEKWISINRQKTNVPFATTVTLLNGIPIESVSKMLGHTNIQTTQHYAKILDIKVGADMAVLKEKFKYN